MHVLKSRIMLCFIQIITWLTAVRSLSQLVVWNRSYPLFGNVVMNLNSMCVNFCKSKFNVYGLYDWHGLYQVRYSLITLYIQDLSTFNMPSKIWKVYHVWMFIIFYSPAGVVMQCYGAGNFPDDNIELLEVLKRACDRGLIIVNTTQCRRGAVSISYAGAKVIPI